MLNKSPSIQVLVAPSCFFVCQFYTGKAKDHGLLYLLVTRITDGRIVQLYGPHHGAANDLNVLYESTFLHEKLPNEWSLGDSIFASILFTIY